MTPGETDARPRYPLSMPTRKLPDADDIIGPAQRGDRAAVEALAAIARTALVGPAQKVAARHGPTVRIDDLIAAGMAKFAAALRSYRPDRGGFVNYLIICGRRAMAEYAAREVARPGRPLRRDVADHRTAAPHEPTAAAAYAALAALPAAERWLVAAMAGLAGKACASYRTGQPAGKPVPVERFANAYNVPVADVIAEYDRCTAKVRRVALGGRRAGRPPHPAPLVRHIHALRSRRLTWKQVAREVNALYGTALTHVSIRQTAHRSRV